MKPSVLSDLRIAVKSVTSTMVYRSDHLQDQKLAPEKVLKSLESLKNKNALEIQPNSPKFWGHIVLEKVGIVLISQSIPCFKIKDLQNAKFLLSQGQDQEDANSELCCD